MTDIMLDEIKSAFVENKRAILIAVIIFLVSIVLGYLLEPYVHDLFNPVVDDLTQKVKTGVIKLTFWSIFSNNIRIVFMMFIFGMLFCFSAVILAFNAFFASYYVATNDNLLYTLLLIIPHGIFEFSSCIIACASGFVLFNFILNFLKTIHKQDDGPVKTILHTSFSQNYAKLKQAVILLIVASVLMAVAGFVEVYLTVPIADFIMSFLT